MLLLLLLLLELVQMMGHNAGRQDLLLLAVVRPRRWLAAGKVMERNGGRLIGGRIDADEVGTPRRCRRARIGSGECFGG